MKKKLLIISPLIVIGLFYYMYWSLYWNQNKYYKELYNDLYEQKINQFKKDHDSSKENFKLEVLKMEDEKFESIIDVIYNESKRQGLNPYHILLLIAIESNFNENAVSSTGDYGLMQINYDTWKVYFKMESFDSLFDIKYNIYVGCSIYKRYLKRTNNDIIKAMLMYNTGKINGKNKPYAEKIFRSKFFNGVMTKL